MSCFECLLLGGGFLVVSGVLVFLAFWFSRFRWLSVVFAVVFALVGFGLVSVSGNPGITVLYCEDASIDSVCVNASVGCADGWVMHGVAACSSPDTICCLPRNSS